MEEKLYTVSEIAKMAGVSLRTIRFYDAKGLLNPVSYSEAGYRYYNRESLVILQRILMLKYLGFSLQQIEEMLKNGSLGAEDMNQQLSEQKKMLQEKKQHLEQLITTIETLENSSGENRWNYLLHLLNLMTEEEKIAEQYVDDSNLKKRINIHAYSTSEQEWMNWVYERLNFQPGEKVLELGCGNGLLWSRNVYALPEGLQLTLTDRSEGMLQETKKNLQQFEELFRERNIHVKYRVMDANALALDEGEYDRIIANHMLYHVQKRENCLQEISKALKHSGVFCCSTIGREHMRELHELVNAFDSQVELPFQGINMAFCLENATEQLQPYFSIIDRLDHENDLIVDNVEVIYNYVYSYPGNAPYILDQKGEKFRKLLQEKMDHEGAFFIHKSTGIFICRK